MPAAAAAAFLDSSPALELSVWHCGHSQGRARCEVWLALDYGVGEVPSWLQGKSSECWPGWGWHQLFGCLQEIGCVRRGEEGRGCWLQMWCLKHS